MTRITEKRDVQDALINYLIGIGWTYLPPEDVLQMRGGDEAQPFLLDVLREQLATLNPGLVTDTSADEVTRRLRLLPATMAGNEDYVRALRGSWTVYDKTHRRERNLALIDYDNLQANQFHFTQEMWFADRDRRRMDMVLWVNGLPVCVIENKSPTVPEAEFEAFDQIQHTYTDRIPEFVKYPPLFAAANARLHYGPTWNTDPKAMNCWKVQGADFGLERLAKSFFDPASLLGLLRDYVIFYRADDQTHKFVLRPHQIRATQKIVQRVMEGLPSPPPSPQRGEGVAPLSLSGRGAGGEGARSGLHWHTQGSGKTLTMIVAAHQLRRELSARGENPTLIIVVDRLELEGQMAQNLEAFGFPAVERARNKKHLRQLLKSDYRGLIVTLIHKFDRMPKRINERGNIVVQIDEAHRSQEGDLATYMRAALPNAFYFGYTGTPVDKGKIGRGTFETFGKADPEGYQDKYGMDESIQDGTTIPLYYTLAPSELHVDRETLEEEFFKVVDEAGVASIEALNALLDKANKLKAVLKAPDRVEKVAAHIAEHFTSNVEPLGFKAFVVAVDREACALYKQALDKHLPEGCSRVVYTPYHKDTGLLRDYHMDEDKERALRKAFRDPDEQPKILIVTEKLLTGYDAPVLYCMYLDKPLKDHTLLQAIARVNRPFPGKKSGLIVDYLGIFENLQRALAFDAATVSTGLIDLDKLRARFADLLTSIQTMLAVVDLSTTGDRPARIIDHFFDHGKREAFVKLFQELQTAYEVLSPDPFLRDYLDDYVLIVQVYQVVYNYFDPEAAKRRAQRDLLKKTDALIRQNVTVAGHLGTLPLYPINRDLANVIKADNVSDRVKVTNLYRSLVLHIEQHQDEQPYLISIGEQVEAIIRLLRERQISVE
ncbi:MAG: HsdR family type I site-specific deoxyribonuclease, partial [Thermoflexales bacterium]|nr:HsdR family type I site-specific deoxyribonuclease [Thermoflexales bacterium]